MNGLNRVLTIFVSGIGILCSELNSFKVIIGGLDGSTEELAQRWRRPPIPRSA